MGMGNHFSMDASEFHEHGVAWPELWGSMAHPNVRFHTVRTYAVPRQCCNHTFSCSFFLVVWC
jgi:hypothetical protein